MLERQKGKGLSGRKDYRPKDNEMSKDETNGPAGRRMVREPRKRRQPCRKVKSGEQSAD